MKINDLRKMSDEELKNEITKNKKELLDMRIKNATGTLEKPSKLKETKKDIAKMLTILNERKLSIGGKANEEK